MVSKYTPLAWYSSASYRLSVSLSKVNGIEDNSLEMSGTLHNFRYIWICDGIFKLILLCIFLIEVIWHKINTILVNGLVINKYQTDTGLHYIKHKFNNAA